MPIYQKNARAIELIPNEFKIKIDSRKFFSKMVDVLALVADRRFGAMGAKLLESITEANKAEKAAFHLVFNALNNASVSLLKEHHQKKIDTLSLRDNFDALRKQTGQKIQDLEISINASIFDNPSGFPFLKKYQQIWSEWLQAEDGLNLTESEAHKLVKELPNQFATSIEAEWIESYDSYKVIKVHFTDNPFGENAASREALKEYYKKIEKLWTDNIFKEKNLSLAKTYIFPDFKISKRNSNKNAPEETSRNAAFIAPNSFKGIHNYINNVFLKNKKAFGDRVEAEDSRLLLLLGQPGQGKTSFCSKVVHDFCNDLPLERDLIFLKLREIDCQARDFLNHPFENLEKQFKKYQFDYENAVIVLDGLDELYMTDGLTNNEITEFINTLIKKTKNRPNIHLIVTSRFHYMDLQKISKKDVLVLSLSPLTLEQQTKWLHTYRSEYPGEKLTEELLVEINDEVNTQFKEIRELINQPILLYLIAKADFEIKASDNRAKIYDELFKVMTERTWDDAGQLDKFEHLEENKERFREYLGTVAFKIYNSDKEWITSEDLRMMKETTEFIEDCKFENIENALKEVLVSFYFRPIEDTDTSSRERSYSVEFFHKSLQEYLAAEHIWRTVLYEFTKRDDKRRRFVINEWEDGLALIWGIGSGKGLTKETSSYLREIIGNNAKKEDTNTLFERLYSFMDEFFNQDFIYKHIASDEINSPITKGVNSFYLFWTILTMCNTNQLIDLRKSGKSFNHLLRIKLESQNDFISLRLIQLEGGNFKALQLVKVDMEGAQLRNCDFTYAFLKDINLKKSILRSSTFMKSHISNVDFAEGELHHIFFSNSEFINTNFSGSTLVNCHFDTTTISTMKFYKTRLVNANFLDATVSMTWFIESVLNDCKLARIRLSNCTIENTNFNTTKLNESYIFQCSIENSEFKQNTFQATKCKNIEFFNIRIEGSNLRSTIFDCCNLSKVNFNKSDLKGAKFINTNLSDSPLSVGDNSDSVVIE